jgi:hypothetical protein
MNVAWNHSVNSRNELKIPEIGLGGRKGLRFRDREGWAIEFWPSLGIRRRHPAGDLGPRAKPELVQDAADVAGDGALGYEQVAGRWQACYQDRTFA